MAVHFFPPNKAVNYGVNNMMIISLFFPLLFFQKFGVHGKQASLVTVKSNSPHILL